MTLKQWLIRFLVIALLASTALTVIQFFKVSDFTQAIGFGVLWGLISSAVYVAAKAYKFHAAGLPILLTATSK